MFYILECSHMALHLVPRSLLYIECVSQLGSIQAASRELGVAASAIYRQIQTMEAIAGLPLFERHPKGMIATATGEEFIELAARWRDDVSRTWSRVKEIQGLELGQVKLAAMDSMVNGIIPEFLAQLAGDHPNVQVDLEIMSPDQAVSAILDRSMDIACAFNVKPQAELKVLWSTELPLGCVASPRHPVSELKSISLSRTAEHPIVLQSRALSVRRYLEKHHRILFADEPQAIVTNSLQLLKRMVVTGKHIALTSQFDVAPELISGDLVFVPVSDWNAAPQTLSVVVNAHRNNSVLCQKIANRLCRDVRNNLQRAVSGEV